MAKYPIPEHAIDPRDRANHDIPLWVVYYYECFPKFLACKINSATTGIPTVWGLSIYRRSLRYRTLGISLDKFEQEEAGYLCYWFNDQSDALEYLRQLTTPPKI